MSEQVVGYTHLGLCLQIIECANRLHQIKPIIIEDDVLEELRKHIPDLEEHLETNIQALRKMVKEAEVVESFDGPAAAKTMTEATKLEPLKSWELHSVAKKIGEFWSRGYHVKAADLLQITCERAILPYKESERACYEVIEKMKREWEPKKKGSQMWIKYRKRGLTEIRPYVEGEDMVGISVSSEDSNNGSPKVGDMIARDPDNTGDKWLVSEKYFKENYEVAD